MMKLVYIGEDDYMACLKRGDVFCSWTVVGNDSIYYIVQNKNGEDIYLSKDEVIIY